MAHSEELSIMGRHSTLTDQKRKEIAIALGQGISRGKLAEKYDVSYNTIKRIHINATNGNEMAKVYKESAEIADDSEKRLLNILEENTPYRIVKKIINILDDEELLKKEIKQRGVNGVNNIVKTFMDLAMKNQANKSTNHALIENNIKAILTLMGKATDMNIDPIQEIKEFKQEEQYND